MASDERAETAKRAELTKEINQGIPAESREEAQSEFRTTDEESKPALTRNQRRSAGCGQVTTARAKSHTAAAAEPGKGTSCVGSGVFISRPTTKENTG